MAAIQSLEFDVPRVNSIFPQPVKPNLQPFAVFLKAYPDTNQ
jgi:hypothetical protein